MPLKVAVIVRIGFRVRISIRFRVRVRVRLELLMNAAVDSYDIQAPPRVVVDSYNPDALSDTKRVAEEDPNLNLNLNPDPDPD